MKKGLFKPGHFFAPEFEPMYLDPPEVIPLPRPCEVNGQVCLFHRFIEEDKAYLKINSLCRRSEADYMLEDYSVRGLIAPGAELKTARTCTALVEFPNGALKRVDPEAVRFLDRKEAQP
jgi:hypothetical protein